MGYGLFNNQYFNCYNSYSRPFGLDYSQNICNDGSFGFNVGISVFFGLLGLANTAISASVAKGASKDAGKVASGSGQVPSADLDAVIQNDRGVQKACKFFGITDYKEALKYEPNNDSAVKSYQQQIDVASKEKVGFSNNLNTLSESILSTERTISGLNAGISSLGDEISKLDEQIKKVQGSPDSYPSTDLNELQSQLNSKKADKAATEKSLSDKKDELEKLNKDLEEAAEGFEKAIENEDKATKARDARINEIEAKKTELYQAVAQVVNNKDLQNLVVDHADGVVNGEAKLTENYLDLYGLNDELDNTKKVKKEHVQNAAQAYANALPDQKGIMAKKFRELYDKLPDAEKKGSLRLMYEMLEKEAKKVK